jgi:putative ABC transport system permease protein
MSTRKRSDDDFAKEIRAHLDIEAARLEEEGMTPEEARAAAHRRFGNVTTAQEHFHEANRVLWFDHLVHDVRCAMRNMRRYPMATLVAMASLGAGIGATTVTLTIRDIVFYKPPPLYHRPEQLSKIQVGRPDRPIFPVGSLVPGALYARWSDTFGNAIAGSAPPRGISDIRIDDRTDTAAIRAVTPGLFSLLGVSPMLGRPFDHLNADSSGPPPAVLSFRVWQRLCDGSADAVGRTVWIDNRPHVIVGVMPARFWFADMNSPIFTLIRRDASAAIEEIHTVVRRPPGVTPEMLEAQLQNGLQDYAATLPSGQRQLRIKVSGIEGTPVGNSVSFVLPYVLGMSVFLTMLIACANAAVLMIAQWTAREHEIAIRASIGASRSRVIRLLLTESVLVALCGGLLGLCATLALRGWIVHGADDAGFLDLSIDPRIFVETAVIALVTGIVAGVTPAFYETRRLHVNPLRTMAGSDRVRQRWRAALVVFEITITTALLVETAAMIDGYQRSRRAELGFSTAPLLTARVENPHGVPTTQVLDVLRRIPGVGAAAASTSIPFAGSAGNVTVATDGSGANAIAAVRADITPDFFAALGVPLRSGRPFARQDSPAARIAIVNETLARQFNLGRNAASDRVWIGDAAYDVVGIVADYSSNTLRPPESYARVFLPLPVDSKEIRRVPFVIRANGDPAALVATVRRALRDITPGTVVGSTYTFDDVVTVIGREILVGTAPLFPLVVIGILLTTAGIYGVLAFAVTRRSRELAVRIAIGATGSDLVKLISAQAMSLVATGSVFGIGATFALAKLVRANGGAGTIFDPQFRAFVIPVVVLLAIGAIATWIPSRRAKRIDPAVLLRIT